MARDSLTIDLHYGNGISCNGSKGFCGLDYFLLERMTMLSTEALLAPKPLVEWSN
jgi:hypothetical protein